MVRRFAVSILLLLAVAATATAERRLGAEVPGEQAGSHLLYLPSGKYLRAIAPGYPEVLADLIYMWSIQYYSEFDRRERYEYLEHIYANVITELDPRYTDPYLIGAMIMAMEAKDVEMALRLLDKGIEANPDDWLMPFEAGFYCYDSLHDYPRAARYFERSARIPGAHPLVRRLHAEMFNKMGDKATSLRYWREIFVSATDDHIRSVAYRHAHDLKIQVDLETIRKALAIHLEHYGVHPGSLQALVAAGIIDRVPLQPGGGPYLYNRNTGLVRTGERYLLLREGV
jgi:tetratricopeptide (TPR) repeat protein